jgi:hypothetical protein
VPLNAVVFRYFADAGSEYLARTWLLSPDQAETATTRAPRGQVRMWNGIDYYVILGNETEPNR